MTAHRNLVLVRCGDASLHPGWLGADRNWDLAISYFGSDKAKRFPEADYVHHFKGGKWNGLFDFFAANPDALQRYDYFWLPDDDIEATSDSINRMFAVTRALGFELAQPSLSQDSFLSHLITLNNPFFSHRNVNFIELMVPVLSRSLLMKTLPLFSSTRSGFGMDFVWHRFTPDPLTQVAIIDSVQVAHTRAVGGALHKMMKDEGVSPARQEQDVLLAPYGEVGTIEYVLGGRLIDGREVRTPFIAQTLAMLGWMSRPRGNRGFTHPIAAWRFMNWNARHYMSQIFTRAKLSPIEPILPPSAEASVATPQLARVPERPTYAR